MEMTALTGQRLSPPQLRLDASSASRPSELKRRSSVTVRAQGEACLVYVESFCNCAFLSHSTSQQGDVIRVICGRFFGMRLTLANELDGALNVLLFGSAASPNGSATDPLLLRAARGESVPRPPAWMMRQAGRYMQVYQELSKKHPSFRERSEVAELAAEVS